MTVEEARGLFCKASKARRGFNDILHDRHHRRDARPVLEAQAFGFSKPSKTDQIGYPAKMCPTQHESECGTVCSINLF